MNELDVPLPPNPIKEKFDFSNPLKIECEEGTINITINRTNGIVVVIAKSGLDQEPTLWTTVYWARAVGIPGVYKERIRVGPDSYRLGALYLYADFALTERESNYSKYGETPLYDEEDVGHGNGLYDEIC